MTLWQDPPLQTRRQIREHERAAALQSENGGLSRRALTENPVPAGEVPDVMTPFSSGPRSATDGGRPENTSPPADEFSRVRPVPPSEGSAFDDLVSSQQQHSALFRTTQPAEESEPPTQPVGLTEAVPATASSEASALPMREPSIRRSRRAGSEAAHPAVPPTPSAGATAAPLKQTYWAPPTVEPAAPVVPVVSEPATEHTLTRRELRELRQADEAKRETADAPVPETSAAVPTPYAAPVASADEIEQHSVSAAQAQTSVTPPEAATPQAPAKEKPYQPPRGHWSLQAAEPDFEDLAGTGQTYTHSVSSEGTSRSTTSALILPSIPSAVDATAPLTSTGEIIVTGSIQIPHIFNSSSRHPSRYESNDVDSLFETDITQTGTESAPIRASRAVSAHTSTRDVISTPGSRGTRLPTILAISAAVLALGVVGLLVAGYVLNIF